MRTHIPTERILDEAEAAGRCAVGLNDRQRRALKRRHKAGELVRPYRNVYARAAYWEGLNPIQRHFHVAAALSVLHPDWVFAGLTAAVIHGLEHGYTLHGGVTITIASSFPPSNHQYWQLRRIVVGETADDIQYVVVSGVRVTSLERTLVDCAALFPFQETLGMFDDAMRRGCNVSALPEYARILHMDSMGLERLCQYADPLSENGGESLVRALIIILGFVVPRLQYVFRNPSRPNAVYRADFMWILPDGSMIVLEFDGMDKYVMQDGLERTTIREKVHAEREREDALRGQRVRTILRLEAEDLQDLDRLRRILTEAGVPRNRQ
ncbi:type IV toxin-antitoxin system AbiEi family antitoxin domain-containing protein [Bifidobacterium leontopitheci]|uniref:CTP synthase n=1 Tax=Bifidobacterium leontopitheci TaxID=2650774 RepID=A0A6I1GXN0_9BIFI|nr:hypothetical protein [Bifidobacterium leontopitheci]KAB7791211.1 hypothetical protein F7D09_0377 [Bifidobacterium leontopitheci]